MLVFYTIKLEGAILIILWFIRCWLNLFFCFY